MAPATPAREAHVVGLEHGRIAEIQRARILSAMLDSSVELGAGNVSVADVVERSGVSRRTFYELFADREDCLDAAFEHALARAREHVVSAYRHEGSWRERVRAGLLALLCFFDTYPQAGRFLISESLAGSRRTLVRREKAISALIAFVEEGAQEAKASLSPPALTSEAVVGGVLAVIRRRLTEPSHAPLVELTNPLMSMIVLPYFGNAAARRELGRAVVSLRVPARSERGSAVDPFKGAGMRLTYRTVRVLMAIAEYPGASNRLIGETAEVRDQGQISKLLARLLRAGMISNSGLGPGTGAANAWTLTQLGRQVIDSVRAHSEDLQ